MHVQVLLVDEAAEVLLEGVAACARGADHIADGNAAVLPDGSGI